MIDVIIIFGAIYATISGVAGFIVAKLSKKEWLGWVAAVATFITLAETIVIGD